MNAPLPLYVEPGLGEALLSWLFRLSERLGTSFHNLAKESFGVDDPSGATQWWVRPDTRVLLRIEEQTGVDIERLFQMTFNDLHPVYRDDEAAGRLNRRRFESLAPGRRLYRFVACPVCLRSDPNPFIRRSWLLGWTAVCLAHKVRMIERCDFCRALLRPLPLHTIREYRPDICARCQKHLAGQEAIEAAPEALALQSALMKAKSQGQIVFGWIGSLTWHEFIILADAMLSGVWNSTTMDERAQVLIECGSSGYDDRHGALCLLAWMIYGWPNNIGARIARVMIGRWLYKGDDAISFHLPTKWIGSSTPEASSISPLIKNKLIGIIQTAGATEQRWLAAGGLLAPLQSSAAELSLSPYLRSAKLDPSLRNFEQSLRN